MPARPGSGGRVCSCGSLRCIRHTGGLRGRHYRRVSRHGLGEGSLLGSFRDDSTGVLYEEAERLLAWAPLDPVLQFIPEISLVGPPATSVRSPALHVYGMDRRTVTPRVDLNRSLRRPTSQMPPAFLRNLELESNGIQAAPWGVAAERRDFLCP